MTAQPMRVFAVANPKGGSAKTTTTVNLAAGLAERGMRVLVIDLDPQGSASYWLGAPPSGHAVPNILLEDISLDSAVRDTPVPGLGLIAASPTLARAEQELASNAHGTVTLRKRLHTLQGWGYVLIDCPATQNILTRNGIAAAQSVIAPMEASVLGVISLVNLLKAVKEIRTHFAPGLCPTRILACRVNTRTRHASEVVEKLREKFGRQVFDTVIRENVRLTECPGFKQPIMTYDPQSSGTADYLSLANELIAGEVSNRS